MGNLRKYRVTKLVTAEERKKYLASEPDFYKTKSFSENLLGMDIKKKNRSKNE